MGWRLVGVHFLDSLSASYPGWSIHFSLHFLINPRLFSCPILMIPWLLLLSPLVHEVETALNAK